MLLATIIAVTLIAAQAALLVGLFHEEEEGEVQAWNYPVTFVHQPGDSWTARHDRDED